MRERRSLLDFAIGASAAVLPVMLGMLLLVAVIRPHEQAQASAPVFGDRYVSVRHLAALKTFETAVRQQAALTEPALALSGAEVLAALPACRSEWGAKWQASLALAQRAAPIPAEHIAAQLGALDGLLRRFSMAANSRVEAAVGLDPAIWFDAARRALAEPFDVPAYPQRRFRVGCADLAGALTALTRAEGRMLHALAWRGTEGKTLLARWPAEQMMAVSARELARLNPWNGLAGCIYLGAPSEQDAPTHYVAGAGAPQRLCALPAMAGSNAAQAKAPAPPSALSGEPRPDIAPDDPRWRVPPSLLTLLRPLEDLRRPTGALYRLYTGATSADAAAPDVPSAYRYGPNRVVLDAAPVDVGFSIDLTIDPSTQALAQKTAACYTGRHDVCRALGMQRADDRGHPLGERLLEGAMVRMAAVAVIDVASGRIEALAGALSPCARQEVDGPGRAANCDTRLPYPVQYRPDALLNQAVFHDAMPASTIKPIIAAALLSDHAVGPRTLAAERAAMSRGGTPPRDSLRGQLMRSDSARFLDPCSAGIRSSATARGRGKCRRRRWPSAGTAAATTRAAIAANKTCSSAAPSTPPPRPARCARWPPRSPMAG